MARRWPLVRIGGANKELQAGDTLPVNMFFTGTATLPVISALGLNGTSTFTVTPVVAGDVLSVGDCIGIPTPAANLTAGLNIGWARVTATNQVTIGLTATLALSLSTMTFTVCAPR